MKAVRYHHHGDPEVLRIEDIPTENPRDDEVLVRSRVAGVNFADTLQRRNAYPADMAPQIPAVPGFEAAGEVEAVGRNVVDFMPADRVLVIARGGCYAQYVTAPSRYVFALPDEITYEQAVALPGQGLTAYFMLEEAMMERIFPSILIHAAAGGVGMLLLQLARLMGAGNVVGTVGSEAKVKLLEEEGLTPAIDYSQPDWAERVLEANGGSPYDLIFDSVGGAVLHNSLPLLAPGGQLTVFGRASGEPAVIDPIMLARQNQTVRGFSLYPYVEQRSLVEEALSELFGYVASDRLKLKITGRFGFGEAALAHRLLEERKTTGKIVLSADLG